MDQDWRMASRLRVASFTDDSAPAVDSDGYIPAKVAWVPSKLREGPPPIYVRVSGIAGGEIELRLDRGSGFLMVLVVLALGPLSPEPPVPYSDLPVEDAGGLIIDTTDFGDILGVVDMELLLRPHRIRDGIRIDVVGAEMSHVVRCGPLLTIALDDEGVLASMSLEVPVAKHHLQI